MRLVGRDGKDIPHRMDLKRSSHDENEVCLIAVFSDARVEAIRQILSKEDNVGLNESTTATAHRNATFIHSFLGNGGGIGFVTANAGAGRTRAMPLDENGKSKSGAPIETVNVLGVDASEKSLLLEKSEEEVSGRGVVLVVGIKHLLCEDPKGNRKIGEVTETEDGGRIC